MDKNAYNAHLRVMKKIEEKYSDKGKYPQGVDSENADLIDASEYYDAKHYTSLYHLFQAANQNNTGKIKRYKEEAKETLEKLREYDEKIGLGKKIGLEVQKQDLDKILEDYRIE